MTTHGDEGKMVCYQRGFAVRDHVSKHVRDLSPGALSSFGFATLSVLRFGLT